MTPESRQKIESASQQDRVIAAVSYVWLLFVVPLCVRKHHPYVGHHAKQGLVLFLFELVVIMLSSVPVAGWLLVAPFGTIICITLAVMGVRSALRGELWEMPYLGPIVKRIRL